MITEVVQKPISEAFVQWDGNNETELRGLLTVDHEFTRNEDGSASILVHWTNYDFTREVQIGDWVNYGATVYSPAELNERYYRPDYLPADPNAGSANS